MNSETNDKASLSFTAIMDRGASLGAAPAQERAAEPAVECMALRRIAEEDPGGYYGKIALDALANAAALFTAAKVAATDEQIDALMPLPVEMGAVYDSAMRAMTCYGFTKDQMRSFARAILAAHAQDVR